MTIQVIGDVLHFDGYVVGRLKSDVLATVRGRFEDALSNAYVDDDKEEISKAKVGDELLKTVLEKAKEAAEAGMIELSDLEQICRELKEVCE